MLVVLVLGEGFFATIASSCPTLPKYELPVVEFFVSDSLRKLMVEAAGVFTYCCMMSLLSIQLVSMYLV